MAILDFKEISQANVSNGKQDTFELFAREFFCSLGFKIEEDPDRGQDGGRDLVISEKRTGILSDTEVRWLVSCKHKAHSGSSVNASDEEDVSDRIQAHKCDGFIGFYSTIVSSPLSRKLESLAVKYEIQIFDREKIERILLENISANKLIKRFFPKSYEELEIKAPSNLFSKYIPLKCQVCGKDLLQRDMLDKYRGIVVFAWDKDYYARVDGKNRFTEIYCVCKGNCDKKKELMMRSIGYITSWQDISDLIIPTQFLKFIMGIINRLKEQTDVYEEEAFEELKNIIILIAQITMKRQSESEIERILELSEIPSGL